jgi:RHS repeat-associated protein
LTGVTYNGVGQLTGTSFGNGVTEAYGYDANRMQLTSHTATQNGGATNGLMNLTYAYTASAGQMGAGTSTGNSGQLVNVSGTIGGTFENAAYSYDNLGRLVTSSQTSNGATAQRSFSYDRWGNRTAVSDATSGGSQIQSITLQQSGGAPTNRIQGVDSSSSGVSLNSGGYLDSADCNSISGWAWDGNQPSTSINVDIYDGNTFILSVAANQFRQDLLNAGLGNGYHGFSFATPASLKNGVAHTIHAKVAGTWIELGLSPKTVTCSAVNSAFGGYLDVADCNTISGWAWDGNQPNTSINVDIYDGNTLILTVAGNQFRQDLQNAGLGNGYHGFSVTTPASLKNGLAHNVHTKVAGTSIELGYSPRSITCGSYSGYVTYTYDSAGNVTNDGAHTYQYDGANRLVNVDGGTTGQYTYDTLNQRYKKVTAGVTTHYIWEDSRVIAEHDGSTGAATAEYVYSGSRMIAKIANGATQYFLSDRFSIRLVLDSSGNVIGRQGHLPFGEDFSDSGSQEKHHFTSYERDGEAGEVYAVNRYYDTSIGRFRSIDPARIGGNSIQGSLSCSANERRGSPSLKHPQLANGFQYAAADPINRGDSVGLSVVCFIDFVPNADPDGIADPFAGNIVFGGCLRSTSEGGGSGGCRCPGTTDCSLYNRLCKRAKKQHLNIAATGYYCKAAQIACNSAPKTGLGSCFSNCIRKCLQNWENSNACFEAGRDPLPDLFVGCEAAAHADCYTGCVGCLL